VAHIDRAEHSHIIRAGNSDLYGWSRETLGEVLAIGRGRAKMGVSFEGALICN
jgi:hypothetical protein